MNDLPFEKHQRVQSERRSLRRRPRRVHGEQAQRRKAQGRESAHQQGRGAQQVNEQLRQPRNNSHVLRCTKQRHVPGRLHNNLKHADGLARVCNNYHWPSRARGRDNSHAEASLNSHCIASRDRAYATDNPVKPAHVWKRPLCAGRRQHTRLERRELHLTCC